MGLAECAAALLLLALGALAGMELVVLSIRAGDALQRSAAAGSLLAGRLDTLMSLPFDHQELQPGGSLVFPRPGYVEDLTLEGRDWRIYRRILLESDGGKRVSLRLIRSGEEQSRPGIRLSARVYP